MSGSPTIHTAQSTYIWVIGIPKNWVAVKKCENCSLVLLKLASMKNLKWLLLREVSLPPTVLAALAKFTELKRLTVDQQQAESPQIKTLREQLPNLTIN